MSRTSASGDVSNPEGTFGPIAVELDLEGSIDPRPANRSFAAAIALAASGESDASIKAARKQKERDARTLAEDEFRAIANRIQAQFGVAIGYERPWAYRPKPRAAYELWKRVVPMFVQQPDTLNIKPTALAKMLDASEPNFTITRDMINAKLNALAVQDLSRLLTKLGVHLRLNRPVSIRSIQKQLVEKKNSDLGIEVEEFSGHFVVRGDTAYVNGKPYVIQLGASGKRRIKIGGRQWLALDTIKAFCTDPSLGGL